MEKRTALYDIHVKLGGKMTAYAGYSLPIHYEAGIIKEHMAVRESAGLFDVSHMGRFFLDGADVVATVGRLMTNDIGRRAPGAACYSPMCNETGGVIDDLLIYILSADRLMIVVNAANREKDFAWMREHLPAGIALRDASEETGLIALQGRKALDILTRLAPDVVIPQKYYTFTDGQIIAGKRTLVSRTGYTGDDGLEFYADRQDIPVIFDALIEAGRQDGILPCGLGARDTLRLEASLPLYGHEMDEDTTPLEAGLGIFVKMDGRDFIGKEAMLKKGAPAVKRIGLELVDKGIARDGYLVYCGGEEIGRVTSGTLSPYSGKAIAMACVKTASAGAEEVDVEARGRRLKAKIVPMPFYKRNY